MLKVQSNSGHTGEENLYDAMMQMLLERGIVIKHVVFIASDYYRSPSMTGREKRLVQCLNHHSWTSDAMEIWTCDTAF